VPTKDGLRLNQSSASFHLGSGGEQRDHRALVPPDDRSPHLPRRHDELLAEQGVLSHQLRTGSQQVSREPPCDRTRPWTQASRIAFAVPSQSVRSLPNGAPSEHETDLPRGAPEFQAHVMLEIFNDPTPDERGSHDRDGRALGEPLRHERVVNSAVFSSDG
jgi:hypothetical protein